MFPKNKQNKLRQTKKLHKRKSFKLYKHNKIRFLFPCVFIFHQINLLIIHKIVFVLFSTSNLTLICLLQSQHKSGVGVKVFNSDDLTLLFHSFYLHFIIDLRRNNNKRNYVYFKWQKHFFFRYNKQTILLLLFVKDCITLVLS